MTKKITLILGLIFCCCQSIWAQQSFTVSQDTIHEFDTSATPTIACNANIKNTTSDTIWINWEVKSEGYPDEWKLYFCDEWLCYTPAVRDGSFYILPNDSSVLVAQFRPNGYTGMGVAGVQVWDKKDSIASQKELVFIAEVRKLSVSQTLLKNVNVFPIPTIDFLNLNIPADLGNVNLTISNHLGQTVESIIVTQSESQIDISHLVPGIYYLKLSQNQNNFKLIKLVKH
jgi:hypothetical protein